jgi:hypothetical protein
MTMQCHSPSVSIPYRPLNFDRLENGLGGDLPWLMLMLMHCGDVTVANMGLMCFFCRHHCATVFTFAAEKAANAAPNSSKGSHKGVRAALYCVTYRVLLRGGWAAGRTWRLFRGCSHTGKASCTD